MSNETEFDLVGRYLHDWPPTTSVEARDAAAFGIAFLVLIAVLLTACTLCDVAMCRRRHQRRRQEQWERNMLRILDVFSDDDIQRMCERHRRNSHVPRFDLRRSSGLRAPKVVPYMAAPPPSYSDVTMQDA